ncbi:hypothetical protein N7456_009537 [Penicillium angulare]|uniref:Stc1 domain-containing protein n=1 Tax=Penicillium angulare TaxID=116970 RepID=A0A9W9K5T8_9EURO|nr:hypothetical protein N7456_009537 [Penicillium angulare]
MAPKKVLSAKKQKGFSDAGYSPALREIICAICHQPHSQEHYSKGQLLSLRQALYSQGDPVLIEQRVAKCPACCSAAAAERKCRFCGHWKSIDNFARTQRILEQPACKKCQDYYQESAFALGLPAPIDDSLIEAEDEQNNQLLLLSNEDGSSHDSSNNETMIGSSSEAHGVDNDVDGDGDDEVGSKYQIVSII